MRWLILLMLPLLFAPASRADEKADEVAKQKTKVLEILKKCDVNKPGLIETQDLIVCGPLTNDKLKMMGEIVQKRYAAAFKALKFEYDNPPKGKLTIFFFPERKKYTFFVNDVAGERPEKDERSHADGRADVPYVVVSVLPGEKPTDLELEASVQAAVALFQVKAGPTKLPSWMTSGFQRAMRMRIDTRAGAIDRAEIRKLVPNYKLTDVWMGEGDAKVKQLLATNLMEYLVFGPESAKLGKLLSGYRGGEGDKPPPTDEVLKGADFTIPKLEAAWKKWAGSAK